MLHKQYCYKLVAKEIFRACDIRGIVDVALDEDVYYSLGKGISCYLKMHHKRQIFLACDGRLTSNKFAVALQRGLEESGIDVVLLGVVPTPVMYFAALTQSIDSGLIVTGSHNPPHYNGIKLVVDKRALLRADLDQIYHWIESKTNLEGMGSSQFFDIMPQYIDKVLYQQQLKRPLKVVVDAGSGVSGPLAIEVLSKLGCEVIPLYCELDGLFPFHHPDPAVEENLNDLKNLVSEKKADLGLAFDGDGDRLGVVTEKGEMIWPDRLMMFYAQNLLARMPGSTIVFDVKCSRHLTEWIRNLGGNPVMCPTGHSLVKQTMREHQAILAGEMSGHLFFQEDWYGFDDALLSAVRLLSLLSQSVLPASAQFSQLPRSFFTPEYRMEIEESIKFTWIKQFCEQVTFKNATLIRIDGIRAEFEAGWGLLRASNTSPCIVARFEAKDEKSLETIKDLFRKEMLRLAYPATIMF